MAYDEALAQQVRDYLESDPLVTARKMFGGLAFMHAGNMFCGMLKDDLMVRVGPERYDWALTQPHVRPMDFTGRAMKGMVYVGPEGWRSAADLERWLEAGLGFARALPPKKGSAGQSEHC